MFLKFIAPIKITTCIGNPDVTSDVAYSYSYFFFFFLYSMKQSSLEVESDTLEIVKLFNRDDISFAKFEVLRKDILFVKDYINVVVFLSLSSWGKQSCLCYCDFGFLSKSVLWSEKIFFQIVFSPHPWWDFEGVVGCVFLYCIILKNKIK